jgi:hypothetical protein
MKDEAKCAAFALGFIFIACVVGFVLSATLQACQPPSPNTSPQPHAQMPVTLGPVVAEGSCKGSLGIDLQVGILSLPIRAALDTHASPGGAAGTVSLDIAGLLQAQCTIVEGAGACAVSGLLAPRETSPAAPALKNEGGADAAP